MSWLTDKSNSAHTLTASGDALNGSPFKYGTAAAQFGTLNGAGSVSTTTSTDWQFGSSDFTVELWFNAVAWPTDTGDTRDFVTLIGQLEDVWPGTSTNQGWGILYNGSGGTPGLIFDFQPGSGQVFQSDQIGAVSTGAWHHVAVSRTGSTLYFFLDGVLKGTTGATSGPWNNSTLGLYIGNDASGQHEFKGAIDEVRITNGFGRYTSTFTPVGPFPSTSGSDAHWSNVVLLTSFDGNNTYSLSGVSATGAPGSVVAHHSATLALTGAVATGMPGTLGPYNVSGGTEGVALAGVAGAGVAAGMLPVFLYPMYLTLSTPQYVTVGWESDKTKNLTGVVTLTLPLPSLAVNTSGGGLITATMALPVPALQITGSTALVGTVALAMPSPQLAVSGLAGLSGMVGLALPAPVLLTGSNPSATLKLPVPVLSVTGATGVVGTVSMALPAPQLVANARVPFVASPVLTLPVPVIAARGLTGNVSTVASTLRGLALAANGYTGIVGEVTLALPMLRLDVEGYQPAIGVVQLTLPSLRLVATGNTVSTGTPVTVAMHTETSAVWTYSNYPFNSYAQFNGVYLGAGNGGIFALTGDTDNGALIQAAARVGITDFGTSFLKRVDRCYVGYRTNGNLVLRIFTDEVNVRDYLLTATGKAGLHGNHTRLGKGLAARYYQFEVRNQNGADFEMNMIELKPTELKRRIGGGDA